MTETPKCRFCEGTEGPFETTQARAGTRRGSTSYRMIMTYHHAACAAEFEAMNERSRQGQARRMAEWARSIGAI